MDGYFGLGVRENSYIYLFIGGESILIFIMVALFSRKVGELALLLTAHILVSLSLLAFAFNGAIFFAEGIVEKLSVPNFHPTGEIGSTFSFQGQPLR